MTYLIICGRPYVSRVLLRPEGVSAYRPGPTLPVVGGGSDPWGFALADSASCLGQAGSPLLSHMEATLGLRICLSHTWLGGGAEAGLLASRALRSSGLSGVISSLPPQPRLLISRGLAYSLERRDARLLASALSLLFELTSFRKHKSLSVRLGKVLYMGARLLSLSHGISGLKICIRGKIGVGGNAKKRSMTIDAGGCSHSTKSVRLSLAQSQARTPTGALGILVIIAS